MEDSHEETQGLSGFNSDENQKKHLLPEIKNEE